ncbi:hypothetical protein LOZ23_002611 [Ophidiomyces ophidiicola]|nr:hypothetical protein LOZ23_002611 [Ophidiomyces ophidiicola]KAI2173693.1 hypothetical protein LOZ24_004531 [Ophidiomyces ophidiicola]KAI2189302.1 hypothetical protein LOZ21_002513 [Ophidiomyces ophidiicola]
MDAAAGISLGHRADLFDRKRAHSRSRVRPHFLLKKPASAADGGSLDLGLSVVENEGLGISTTLHRPHMRSLSGGSATLLPPPPPPGASYVHPMRQTPRPYTPPAAATAAVRSHHTSLSGSAAGDDDNDHNDDSQPFPDLPLDDPTSSARLFHKTSSLTASDRGSRCPSAAQHYDVLPPLHPVSSQTNIAGGRASSSLSRPVDGGSLRETVSPISRSSLDFPFRSKSSRTSTTTATTAPPITTTTTATADPAVHAAAVIAARQAFEDREAAKSRKLEQRSLKAQGKKQLRRQQQQRPEHGRGEGGLSSSGRVPHLPFRHPHLHHQRKTSDKSGSYSDGTGTAASHSYYEGAKANGVEEGENARSSGGGGGARGFKLQSPRSAWLLFLTWLRTRIFKMGKKIKKKTG